MIAPNVVFSPVKSVSMNGLERCISVLNGETPDKIPIVPQAFLFSIENAGYKVGEVNRNPQKMCNALIRSWEKYRYDGIVIDFDDATTAEACGATTLFRLDEPAIVDESNPVIKSWADLDNLRIPDPMMDGRIAIWLETTNLLSQELGKEVLIMGRADQGPFSTASLLRSTQHFMMDLITEDPDQVHALIEFARLSATRFAKAQKDAGAHITSIGDALAGPNLISPDMYREFAWKPQKKMVEELSKYAIPFSIHICGNTNSILPDMVATGAQVLEIDWQVDMAMASKLAQGKCVLMGNINPSDPMVIGTTKTVRHAVETLLSETGGRGLWLSTGCAMGRNTPPENFQAFIDTAREFVVSN